MAVKREHEGELSDSKRVRREAPSEPSRAVFIPNVGPTVTYYDLCKIANQYGAIENIKINPQKKYAFINFVDQGAAEKFYAASQVEPPKVGNYPLKVGWARCEPLDQETLDAVANGATRNLFVAQAAQIPEDALAHTFSRFGEIENIVCIPGKNIVFVNLTSLKGAIQAQRAGASEALECAGRKIRVNFAKEGVQARDPRQRQQQGMQGMPPMPPMGPPPMQMPPMGPPQYGGGPQQAAGSRAIFLGNVPEETSSSDLCKLGNRYGAIEQITINHEKHSAFINFIDINSAMNMFTAAQQAPITLHQKPVRINWAKSNPLKPDIMEECRRGATRNLWLGGVPESATDENLREIFAKYGEIEGIVIPKSKKNIAFVNFTSLRAAMNARREFQTQPLELHGAPIKVNFAKETIRGPPPPPPSGYDQYGPGPAGPYGQQMPPAPAPGWAWQ